MGDKIVVMNNAVVEQFGTPQEIYDMPATKFVANFIGSPPMNFLDFEGSLNAGASTVTLSGQKIKMPKLRAGASGKLVYGIRPEHIELTDKGGYRGEVIATEYLGTTQIITLDTPNGEVKARVDSSQVAKVGEKIGLKFAEGTATLFDGETGFALRSSLNEGVL